MSWLLALIVAGIMVTIRWRMHNPDHAKAVLAAQDGFVLVFWHERIIAMPWLWPRRYPMHALQSPHPDGRLLAHTVNHLGVKTVWGSSNRNAVSGLRGLKRILDVGKIAAITPDGPRGPARQSAVGPVALARLANKPILPVAWSVDRYWRAPGWDGMIIPKPFAKGVFLWGDLITTGEDPKTERAKTERAKTDGQERQRQAVEDAMNAVTDRADALIDRPNNDGPHDDGPTNDGPTAKNGAA